MVGRYDSLQGGSRVVLKVCQLIERCDAHGKRYRCFERCDTCQEL